tara:strand:+ start:338 stop:766 length:429 start_codon:yes stop_codon:yes gene_type:complete
MSAGNFTFYNEFKESLAKADIDLNADTFKAVLLTSSYSPNVATNVNLSDISANITTDSDYTAQTLTNVTVTESGGTVTFDADDINFGSSVTITAKYLAIYDDTVANDPLVVYVDLDTGGGSVSSTSSTFQVTINASGIFTLA